MTNPKIRWHLSDAEKAKIRELTLAGVRQSEISRALGITAPSVSKAQRAMGLRTRLAWPEKKILRLFKRGWGGIRISKVLHVPANQVYRIAHDNHFRRADGIGYPEPHGDVAGFIQALKKRQGYIRSLAKAYGVGFCQAREIAHEVLATVRFRPGASKPALSSDFPQRHFDVKSGPDQFVELVERVLEKCFGGKLPLDNAAFLAAMMAAFGQTTLQGQAQLVIDCFAEGLAQAIACIRQQNSAWKN